MQLPKLYIGPMSKNVVDAALEISNEENIKLGFIPSRRQVAIDGGYVNDWSTESFSEYVNSRLIIQRDHGGPEQGHTSDDGIESIVEDAKHFNIIHIDPWKKTKDLNTGISLTVNLIKRAYAVNPNVLFEVGTEEAIRKFDVDELDYLLRQLQRDLSKDIYDNIKYAVVQSGVGLDLANSKNTGQFSKKRLIKMLDVCKNYGLLSKEHNGDFLNSSQIKSRFDLGLSAINIAPEFGQIETRCYVDNMTENNVEMFYDICYNSGKWKKWVKKDFVPSENKKQLINICGHYVFSTVEFEKIKINVDLQVKKNIKKRIREIYE
jgi:hypothetical protein|tara:strand:+ start:992 stop:1951 length:960 start_codon:yes stop_codon:yes gene_type:complete